MTWPFGDLDMFGYDFIMVDFPWRFEAWSTAGRNRKSPDQHYETMTCDEIVAAFPVDQLARGDCVLWMWATHPMIDQQIDLGRRLGFRFATSGVWVKRTTKGGLAFGTGYRLRSASEPFLIFVVGNPRTRPVVRTAIEGRLRQHSRKPDEAYTEAERMMPNARRADLFSRETRAGWESWGDEIGLFDQEAC